LKFKELRSQLKKGVDSLDNGKGIPAETVLRKLRERSEQRLKEMKGRK
jgi:hypothetical protein